MRKLLSTMLCLVLVLSMVFSMASCGGFKFNEEGEYTYMLSISEFPSVWNPHTYQTATDSLILDYTSVGFYTFDYNDTKDGYQIVPEMATKDPEDVTSQYVGQYGIEEGDANRAYKITLRNDLKWDDGTPITAHDFVTSAQLLLNPVANNYRADSLYSGSFAIVNARNYLYQGKHAYPNLMVPTYADEEYVAKDAFTTGENGILLTPSGADIAFYPDNGGNWSSNSLNDYYKAGGYFSVMDGETDLYQTKILDQVDDEGKILVTAEIAALLSDIIAQLHGYADAAEREATDGDYTYNEWQEFCFLGSDYPELAWEGNVGMFALSDTEFVFVLEKELAGFYLLYNLTGTWLVKEDLYKECESMKDGVYTNSYGTTLATTPSYGPYKLVDYKLDKNITFEKNDAWYGYGDAANAGLYQTTRIHYECAPEASTRLEMFINGELDSYGLTAEDMTDYAKSDYCYYTTGDSTFFMALNPDLEALKIAQSNVGENINKTILTIKEFRMALSFALNRAEFCLATSPTNNASFAVFSSYIISNPEIGEAYRTTDVAKKVVTDFWNLTDDIGAGKLYANADEAIATLTGYNLAEAQVLFNTAYDKAIADGLMDADDVIEIKIGTPNNTSNFYNKGYEFLVNNYTEAVKGTKLEGKLTFTLDSSLGNGFSDALKANNVDMLFGVGWTGSALDPYGLMEAYTAPSYQYDPAWDTKTEQIGVTIDGVEYFASVYDWTYCIAGETITAVTADKASSIEIALGSTAGKDELRLEVLGLLEGAVLQTYDMIPMMDDSSASLKGMKINFYTEEYIYGVGRGGIKYMSYNYDDAEWEAFVKSQGGSLNYK
ncbi:MAG: hypothetical protein J6D21_00890 [Clostridia bacterium]|nr:hypothetical protein [Clostridia bacterium]